MGKQLRQGIVAERVETLEQMIFLRKLGSRPATRLSVQPGHCR